MDNLTHSLIGFAAAEVALRARARLKKTKDAESTKLRPWFWFASFAANNAPDLDFLIPHGYAIKNLGYMLQHRGYTHTLIGALAMSLFSVLVTWMLSKIWKTKSSTLDWKWITGIAIMGGWTHIGADFWNSYGVHPFWPVENHWHYGDSIFIVEPWIWIALAPMLASCASAKLSRLLLRIIPLIALCLVLFTNYVPTKMLVPLIAITLSFELAWMRIKPTLGAICAAVTIAALGILGFHLESRAAAKTIRARVAQNFPNSKILDIALSPVPASPTCWQGLTVESDSGKYTVRRMTVATSPKWIGAADCIPDRKVDGKLQPILDYAATTTPVQAAQTPALLWEGQFQRPMDELRKLKAENCLFDAFLHFSRAPFWKAEGDALLVGDVRFDRGKSKRGFGLMQLPFSPSKRDCESFVPGWMPPSKKWL